MTLMRLSEQAKMGSRIRVLRDEKRLMQLDMAREMGISVSLLSRIENGLEKLTVDNLLKLCRFLNVSADRILGLERPE